MSVTSHFDIRQQIDFDASGRAACPACEKPKQKNLAVDLSTGAYRCWRGCTTEEIRAAIDAPKTPRSTSIHRPSNTVTLQEVMRSQTHLQPLTQAMNWLQSRGFTPEMIAHYRIGLTSWHNEHPAIALHIPTQQETQFYRKLRISPWQDNPDLPKWSQYGVPATIFQTYAPEEATATWFCEGEWDAMRLGWLAHQEKAKVTICCSTAGCGSVPAIEQLEQLPGEVVIWFDRNDSPTKHGLIPGDEGARKLAEALGDRARIAQVPMAKDCMINGWDVSNALDAGYSWADFEQAVLDAEVMPPPNSLRDRLTALLEEYPVPFEQTIEMMNLSKQLGQPYRNLDHLTKLLVVEQDQALDQTDSAARLKDLLRTRQPNLDLHNFLEPWFADILVNTAKAMPTAPEFLFTTLLSAAASRVGTSAQVIIKPSAKYSQPMVFWSAIVANSGSMKTPAQRIILDPLVELEKQAYEIYCAEMENYEQHKAAGEKVDRPIRRRYLTKDATIETLQRIHGENPRGILYYRDEMAGAIKGRDQYRKGRGADEEAELDQWTGAAIIVDRAEKATCLPKSAISRTGSIQWEVLADLMGDHCDANGAWSRWLFCAADAPTRYLSLSQVEADTGISETLLWLYSELDKLPRQDYLLDEDAKRLFESWQRQLVDEQQSQQAFGLQLVYPKMEAYTARLALWLHIVNAVLRRETPPKEISGLTMGRAIDLAAYYLWQHRLIHTQNSPDSGLAGIALTIHRYVERMGEASASKLKSGVRSLRKMATDQIRKLMQTLAQAGYGSTIGNGKEMVYTAMPSPDDTSQIDRTDSEMPPPSFSEIPISNVVHPTIDRTDSLPPEDSPPSNSVEITSPTSLGKGQLIQVWRSGRWRLATYLRSLNQGVLSECTRRLDDGHHVQFHDDPDLPQRVAQADIRIAIP